MSAVGRTGLLAATADQAFAWHERAGALERLLPPWERVEVVERSGGLDDGGRVVLRVGVGPATVRWVARHRDYVPGRRFVDEQIEGPFARWVHSHEFEVASPIACRVTERIDYDLPLAPLGNLAGSWLVRRRLRRMLAYRQRTLAGDLAEHGRFAERARLHVAVTGASGLIGSALVPFLTTGGHRVTRIVRRRPGPGEIEWDPGAGRLAPGELEGVDAVVHLAGEAVGTRWTEERKRRILESRTRGTSLLAETLARLSRPPRVLVAASAVGVYGDRGEEMLTEDSPPPSVSDFLSEVGRAWEAATAPARDAGIRVVSLRFGVVLTPAGGALARMLPAFQAGAGGSLGSGRQWMSWIAIEDAIGAVHQALCDERLAGPVNATAPWPVPNREFTRILARVLSRPALVPVPETALRLVLGEMAPTALLASQRVRPAALEAAGYEFRYPELRGALRHLLGGET